MTGSGWSWAGGRRGEAGSALVEFTWLAMILLVPLTYVLLSVFEVQRGAFAVSAAARAAGRAYALAETDAAGLAQARAVARRALADQGLAAAPLEVRVSCAPNPGNCHSGGSVIAIGVRSRVRLPLLPDVFGGGAPTFRVEASHRVPFGQFQETS